MKKIGKMILCLLFSFVLIFPMCACGEKKSSTVDDPQTSIEDNQDENETPETQDEDNNDGETEETFESVSMTYDELAKLIDELSLDFSSYKSVISYTDGTDTLSAQQYVILENENEILPVSSMISVTGTEEYEAYIYGDVIYYKTEDVFYYTLLSTIDQNQDLLTISAYDLMIASIAPSLESDYIDYLLANGSFVSNLRDAFGVAVMVDGELTYNTDLIEITKYYNSTTTKFEAKYSESSGKSISFTVIIKNDEFASLVITRTDGSVSLTAEITLETFELDFSSYELGLAEPEPTDNEVVKENVVEDDDTDSNGED